MEPSKAEKRIRVILVFDNLEFSGAEKVGINLLRNADRFRLVDLSGVICMDDRLGCARVSPNLHHLTAHWRRDGGLLRRLIRAISAIFKLRSASLGADILIPVTPPAALISKLAAFGRPILVIPWVHFDFRGTQRDVWPPDHRFRGWIQRVLYLKIIPKFKRIIFVSEGCLKSFPIPRNRDRMWVALPNVFVPESFVTSVNSRTAAKIGELKMQGRPILAFIGRIFRQKRWEDSIKVAELLRNRGFDFHMVFIGDGIEQKQFLASIDTSPARDVIHYLGTDENVQPALEMTDGLILTSLFEAWPTVILEAFSAMVPVFAYDCPSGPREMLGNGSRGQLTDESPAALATAIIEYFDAHPQDRRTRLADARRFIEQFSPTNAIPIWESKLRELAVV
jgi:glycosyltransferase involved in cell wall biosynthesis